FGHKVELDDPVRSKGNNPDVMFEIEAEDQPTSRWALAIKTVSTTSGQTLFENIQKAAKQIDAEACPADRGIVVINLKNSIQHKLLWDITYTSLEEADAALRTRMRALIDSSETDRLLSDWEAVFAKRTSPLVFFYCQAVVRLRPPGGQDVAMILKVAEVFNPLGREDDMAKHIAYYLNHFMQVILDGVPGAPGQAPS
ncbi:MAG TPA: hypothetical protein PLS60_08105, partial [Arenimonas sp.]|nr:hypothetical protein [Arenimonas sp.]